MALTADDFLRQMLALLPPGDAWSRSYSELPASVLDGCAPEFARIQERADALLLEINPATTTELIAEWEYANGLPDECMEELTDLQDRRDTLVARLQEQQTHNPADYVAIAVALGHTGATCHRRPYLSFRAGISRAGDSAQGDEWAFVFILAYMAPLIASPNAFGTWTATSTTVTANANGAPDETITADHLNFGAAASLSKTLSPAPEHGQFSVWLLSESSTIVDILIEMVSTSAVVVETLTVKVGPAWKNVKLRAEHATGIATVRISAANGITVYAWGAEAGAVDPVVECRINTVAQAHTIPDYRVIGSYVPTPD